MNRTEHLLSCLSEECSEVSHRVSKALRFGLDEIQENQKLSNRERIHYEVTDLLAVLVILSEERIIDFTQIEHNAIYAKMRKIERWMKHAEENGSLIDK